VLYCVCVFGPVQTASKIEENRQHEISNVINQHLLFVCGMIIGYRLIAIRYLNIAIFRACTKGVWFLEFAKEKKSLETYSRQTNPWASPKGVSLSDPNVPTLKCPKRCSNASLQNKTSTVNKHIYYYNGLAPSL
jgi:hypothetical protein